MESSTETLIGQLLRMSADQALHASALDRALDELVKAIGSGAPLADTLRSAAAEKWRDDQEIAARLRRWAVLGQSNRGGARLLWPSIPGEHS
jgi:hypothetical protein